MLKKRALEGSSNTGTLYVLLLQLCLTFCDPMDCCPSGSSVHGILQARIVEWVVTHLPGDLPDPGIESMSLISLVLAGGFFSTSATWEAPLPVHSPLIVQKGGGLLGWQPLLPEPSTAPVFTHPHWIIWDHTEYSTHTYTHTHLNGAVPSPQVFSQFGLTYLVSEKKPFTFLPHTAGAHCVLCQLAWIMRHGNLEARSHYRADSEVLTWGIVRLDILRWEINIGEIVWRERSKMQFRCF